MRITQQTIKKRRLPVFFRATLTLVLFLGMFCGSVLAGTGDEKIIFLHHSTGSNIWNGGDGVPAWFTQYNTDNGTGYQITENSYPDGSHPWANYPYDYWNCWVNHSGTDRYLDQETLEDFTAEYDVIIFKHCYLVSDVLEDTGSPDITSSRKSSENYKLQYAALKEKLHSFPNHKFILWTGAARIESETTEENAQRAKTFFEWVKDEWDEPEDNIFIYDFREAETEGGLYLKDEYSTGNSHPNETFCAQEYTNFCQRIIEVINDDSYKLAIPGALGFGKHVRGAYAGSSTPTILTVDRLTDDLGNDGSTKGSLRWCLTRDYPRIILFEVSGYINLESYLVVSNDYVSIYGQTAPSPGITVSGVDCIYMQCNQFLIQHLRFRLNYDGTAQKDALTILKGSNGFIDHCSFSYGEDENVGVGGSTGTFQGPLTIQNCIVSHGLNGDQSKGMLVGGEIDSMSVIRTAFIHCANRTPYPGDDSYTKFEAVNTLSYNNAYYGQVYSKSNAAKVSVIGNEWRAGNNTSGERAVVKINDDMNADARFYLLDNYTPAQVGDSEWDGVVKYDAGDATIFKSDNAFDGYETDYYSYTELNTQLSANAGARPWDRDGVDVQAIEDMINGTGNWIDDISEADFPTLAENQETLDIPADPHEDDNGNGFTNLEDWVHSFGESTPADNEAPVVNAGSDQSITLPTDTINLDGTVTDDGLPVGSTVSYQWSVVSGGTVTFADANAVDTTATFSAEGTYVLRLTADDGELQASDDISITVNPSFGPEGYILCANEWETVEFTETVDVAYGLNGSYYYLYGVTGSIAFTNTTFGDPLPGVGKSGYYRLSAAQNTAPVVNAGSDQSITLPTDTVLLDGTVTDDGLPAGSTVSYLWSVVSGGTVTFADANAVDTTATFSAEGTYVLRLTADDSDLQASDDITITVNPSFGPDGYTWCANEWETVEFTETVDVAYGLNGSYYYLYGVTGSIAFTNITFGDPLPGIGKSGYYRLSTTTENNIELTDDFSDSDMTAWTIVDEGDIAGPSKWSVIDGEFCQTSNIYSVPDGDYFADGRLGTFAYYNDPDALDWTDYQFSLIIRSEDDDGIGVMFYYQDPDNYYRFEMDKQRNMRKLIKKVDGEVTLLAEDSVAFTQDQTYELTVTIYDGMLNILLDDEEFFDGDVSDANLTSGTVGLYSWGNTGAYFDDIKVTSISPDQDAYLVASWKFDEGSGTDAVDASENNNTGVLADTTAWTSDGISGSALLFDGFSNVIVQDSESLSITDSLTLSAWINADDLSSNHNIIAKDGNNSYRFRMTSSQLWLLLEDGTGWEIENAEYEFATGQWYHVAVTADLSAGEVKFYVNGQQIGSTQTTGKTSIADTEGSLVIGSYRESVTEGFVGMIDEVKIHSTALSAEEVRTLAEMP